MAEPDPELRTGVHSLWEEGLLFDYTIEVQGHEFRAHKAVLASMSGYFKILLTNGMLESSQDRLKLPGFSSQAMHNVIEFIYKEKFGDTKASPDELFELSVYLEIPSAIRVCTDELCEGLDPENCLDIFNLFLTHNVTEGTKQVTKYIKGNIDAVLGVHNVDDLPSQLVSHLHDCLGKSEWDLFCSLKDWVNADYDNHKQHVDGLMSKVRFPLMAPAQLLELKKQDIYTQCPGTWHDLIEKAIKYHRMPIHKKVLDKSEQTQVRGHLSPVCFPVNDKNPECHVLHDGKSWEEHEGLLAPTFAAGAVTVVVNNFLVVYDQSSEDKNMYIFDPRTLTWSEMANMGGPRFVDFALVHHDQHLYAMAGRVGSNVISHIRRYNFSTNQWHVTTTFMPQAIHKHAACVVQDSIFVSGGKHALAGPDTRRVHCLDLNTSTWTAKAPLLLATSGHKMDIIVTRNRTAIVVLKQDVKLQMYSVATDQWSWMDVLQRLPSRVPLKLNTNSTILRGCGEYWLLNTTLEVDPTQVNWVVNPAGGVNPNRRSKHGVCYKWRFSDKAAELVDVPGRFPLYVDGANEDLVKNYFTAMLRVPLHSRKARPGPVTA